MESDFLTLAVYRLGFSPLFKYYLHCKHPPTCSDEHFYSLSSVLFFSDGFLNYHDLWDV